MTTLHELREQRVDAETHFQQSLQQLSELLATTDQDLIAAACGYHREVSALFSAELSLISDGRLPESHPNPNAEDS